MADSWVIEAYESPFNKPSFLAGPYVVELLMWDDNVRQALKFKTATDAQKWLLKNRVYCGIRLKKYAKTKTRRKTPA